MTTSKKTDWIAAVIGMTWAVATIAIDKMSPHRFPDEAVVSREDIYAVVAQSLVLLAMGFGWRLAFKIWIIWCAFLLFSAIVGLLHQGVWYPPPIWECVLDVMMTTLFLAYCNGRLKTLGPRGRNRSPLASTGKD